MRKELAATIPEYYLCPLCMFGDGQWSEVEKHLVEAHTDEEALDYFGYDPTEEGT